MEFYLQKGYYKLGIILGIIIIIGCAQGKVAKHSRSRVGEIPAGGTIAVMPFQSLSDEKFASGDSVRCPICGAVFRSGVIEPNAEETLTRFFFEKLSSQGFYDVLPLDQVKDVVSGELSGDMKEFTIEKTVQVGKMLGADAVVIGFVLRYRKREGTAHSVKRPASVAFGVHMVGVKDNKLIWHGSFEETQRSLSENILELFTFFKRGRKWLTADELAEYGVDKVLKNFTNSNRQRKD